MVKNKKTVLFLFSCILLTALISVNCQRKAENPKEENISELYKDTENQQEFSIIYLDELEIQSEYSILLAFIKAYPKKIKNVEFINDDWVIQIDEKRFYFADNRFIPEELHERQDEYRQFESYIYPWKGTVSERNYAYRNPGSTSIGSHFLFDALYLSQTEDESWECQVKYSFLGVKMLVHSHIKPLLDKIAEQIYTEAETDPSINEWIAELMTSPPTSSWNWRNIRGASSSRSNHAYGIAIDLAPREYNGRYTFWQWHWHAAVTLTDEIFYLPPKKVINIFEEHGFLWGGNWDLYDTMHFEYRPEILLLNGFAVKLYR